MELRHVGDARRTGRGDWWRAVGLDRGWGVDVVRALFPLYTPIGLTRGLSVLTNDGKDCVMRWQDCSAPLSVSWTSNGRRHHREPSGQRDLCLIGATLIT